MKQAKDLATAIKKLVEGSGPTLATVVTVDKSTNCCDVTVGDDEFGQIRLQAIVKENTKGCRTYPAPGSKVMIEPLNDTGDWKVSLYSEIEEVVNEVGNTVYRMNSDGHTITKGNDNLKQALTLIIQASQQSMILYGNNLDFLKLQQALTIIENVLE